MLDDKISTEGQVVFGSLKLEVLGKEKENIKKNFENCFLLIRKIENHVWFYLFILVLENLKNIKRDLKK